jgi:hypothetical protein
MTSTQAAFGLESRREGFVLSWIVSSRAANSDAKQCQGRGARYTIKWTLPALAAPFDANQGDRISAFVEEFPARGALEHQVHHAANMGLRLWSHREVFQPILDRHRPDLFEQILIPRGLTVCAFLSFSTSQQ